MTRKFVKRSIFSFPASLVLLTGPSAAREAPLGGQAPCCGAPRFAPRLSWEGPEGPPSAQRHLLRLALGRRRIPHTRLPPKPARRDKRIRCRRRHPALIHRDPFMGPPRRPQAETGRKRKKKQRTMSFRRNPVATPATWRRETPGLPHRARADEEQERKASFFSAGLTFGPSPPYRFLLGAGPLTPRPACPRRDLAGRRLARSPHTHLARFSSRPLPAWLFTSASPKGPHSGDHRGL